jgi:hypothetical protein
MVDISEAPLKVMRDVPSPELQRTELLLRPSLALGSVEPPSYVVGHGVAGDEPDDVAAAAEKASEPALTTAMSLRTRAGERGNIPPCPAT